MANRFIDATLRFRDEFSGEFGRAAKQMSEQEKHLRSVSGAVTKVGRGFTNAGKTLTAGVTAPIAGLAVAAVKTSANFDQAMAQVAASMGTTVSEIQKIREEAKKLGEETAFSNAEAAGGFNILAQAGLSVEEQLEAIRPVLDLAAAGSIDMGNAAAYVTGAVKGFGDEMKNANTYADQIALGATLAKTDVEQFGAAVSSFAPKAKGYGQSAISAEAALLRLANANITGEKATTQLQRAMANIYSPSAKAKKALSELGVSAYDSRGNARDFNKVVAELQQSLSGMSDQAKNAKLSQIFSTVGLNAYRSLVSTSADETERLMEELSGAGGAAGTQAKTMLDNLNGQLTILKSSAEGILTTVGDKLMPYVTKGVQFVQSLSDRIKGLSDGQWDLIVKIAGVAAVLGPALLVIGKVVMTVGKVIKVISTLHKVFSAVSGVMSMTNPVILIVVAVVAALAAIGYVVYKNWDKIKPLFEKVGEALKKFGAWCKDIFFKVKDWFVNTYNNLKEKFTAMLDKVRSSPGILGAVFKTIKGYIDAAKQVFSGIIQFVKGVFSGNWKMAWQGIVKIFGGIWAGLKNYVKTPINAVIGLVNGAIKAINKIQINIPDWVPIVGGKTLGFHLKTIPFLAKGSPYFTGGPALINERGGEIVNLPRGTQIIPHDQSIRQAVGFGQQLEARRLEGRLVQIADVLRTRSALQLPQLSAAAATAKGTATKPETVEKHITVAKIADTVVIREKADADELAEILAKKLEELDDNVA